LPTNIVDQLDPPGSIISRRAKYCGMFWTTNHNKAAVHGLLSQPIMAYVDHLTQQLWVAAASGTLCRFIYCCCCC